MTFTLQNKTFRKKNPYSGVAYRIITVVNIVRDIKNVNEENKQTKMKCNNQSFKD